MKNAGYIIGGLIAVAVLTFTANAIGLVNLTFWGPKYQQAHREIFEETQSYVHGKASHISRLRLEYESTESDSRKRALRGMILAESSAIDITLLPPELRAFIQQLQNDIGGIQ